MNTLDRFEATFAFHLATTPALRKRAYALRHAVFRRELDYRMHEDPDAHLEYDEHDTASLIVLLEHRASGIPAGCVRLVPALTDGPDALRRLPLEAHCRDSLTHPTLHPERLPRDRLCEISRLAISPAFRHRAETRDHSAAPSLFPAEERAGFALIGVGLFLAATALVGLAGRHHVFAMMQHRLPRRLAIHGLRFTCVGEPVTFHGLRRAYYIDQRQAVSELPPELRALYSRIEATLTRQSREATPHQAGISSEM